MRKRQACRIKAAGRGGVSAAVAGAAVWEPWKQAAVCGAIPCLPHSIPRRMSDAVPGDFHSGCTGGPGHRVAGRCTVDGSNESRWWIAAIPTGDRAPQLSHYSADFFKRFFLLYCLSFLGGDRLMTQENIQMGAGVLAVILLLIIIVRRQVKEKQLADKFYPP